MSQAGSGKSPAEERLQLALDAGRMGTWVYDLRTGEQVWDARQYALFGLDPAVVPTRERFLDLVLPEDHAAIAIGPPDLVPGARHDSTFRIRRPDGEIRWIVAHSMCRAGGDGTPIELVGVNWDITGQRLAEAERMEAERRLELATTAAEIGIWDWNVETGEFFYSPRAREIYGFGSSEPITFERLQALTFPEDYLLVEPALRRALDPNLRARETYRYRIRRADTGAERWVLAHGGAVFSGGRPDARALRYTGTLQDITTDVATERELEDERARLRLALAAGELAVWELVLASNEIVTSPELNRLYRFPADSSPSAEEFRALYAPGERERVEAEAAASFAAGESTIRFEARHQWPDGVVKWIGVRAQILSDAEGRPVRVLGVAMDVTQDRVHAERLAVTARELQHRVKNSLAVVQSIASHTFRNAPSKEGAVTVFSGRLRALGVATDLLTKGNWDDVPMRQIVEEIVQPFRDRHDDQFILEGPDIAVDGKDAVNVGMALHELSTNAVKYGALSTDAGRVTITWRTEGDRVVLEWHESGGPTIAPPARSGFGTRLLNNLFGAEGKVELDFPATGAHCRLIFPARGLTALQPDTAAKSSS